MPSSRVSSKGQITIPASVRAALGLSQGDEVVLTVQGEEVRMKVVKKRKLTDLYGVLPSQASYPDFGEVRHQARSVRGRERHRRETTG